MASSAASSSGAVVPARLGFLAIFNPSLGSTDETMEDQIVYYASLSTQASSRRRRRRRGTKARMRPTDVLEPEERHERLRQIGLAQGMASFSRGFADGAAVDTIDTERARVVVHELEAGWWILASIDLTKLPLPPRLLPTGTTVAAAERFEYSSREMKPASLLLADLLRAHSIFLMHHGSSLSSLFVHCRRSKFMALLGRYWDLFLSTWNVLLHGNPARDMLGAINVAASGELGMGVGEEDRGSGEREVLEGLVGRIEGLVDLVVSKFGTDEQQQQEEEKKEEKGEEEEEEEPWLGTGREPAADDGAIFLGTGALSRKSLRDVTHWMEDLYTWGEHAYGIIESPTSVRRAKAREAETNKTSAVPAEENKTTTPPAATPSGGGDRQQKDVEDGKLDKMLSYMKLGYGSYWTLTGATAASSSERRAEGPAKGASASEDSGHFLIGLTGEMEEAETATAYSDDDGSCGSEAEHNSRTVLRTVHVELEGGTRPEATIFKDFVNPASELTQSQLVGSMLSGQRSHDVNKADKLRVVVYVNRPFVFAFFFRLHTDSLAWDTMYRSLHYQLAPLRRPLLTSTRYRPSSSAQPPGGLYSLVWDPASLTVRAAVPNIPDQQQQQQLQLGADSKPLDAFWSRADAASTHLQLLLLYAATRSLKGPVERTLKTSRGWWIVWTRLSADDDDDDDDDDEEEEEEEEGKEEEEEEEEEKGEEDDSSVGGKEIFLVRRASDHVSAADAVAAAGLVQGIGVDTRRYVEELLSLL